MASPSRRRLESQWSTAGELAGGYPESRLLAAGLRGPDPAAAGPNGEPGPPGTNGGLAPKSARVGGRAPRVLAVPAGPRDAGGDRGRPSPSGFTCSPRLRYLTGITEYDDGVYLGGAVSLISGTVPYHGLRVFVQPPGILLLMVPVALLAERVSAVTQRHGRRAAADRGAPRPLA